MAASVERAPRAMSLRFTKMHGLGNDFVVLDARAASLSLDDEQVRTIADRRTGIGFDQLLMIEPARDPDCDFAYSIRNADGSFAQQCGNGVRCIAAWLRRDGALRGNEARLQGPAGVVEVKLLEDGRIAVDMGTPEFEPAQIPFDAPVQADTYALDVEGRCVKIGAASMGNPHVVIEVENTDVERLHALGPAITTHSRFPRGVNAGFAQVLSRDAVFFNVYNDKLDVIGRATAASVVRSPSALPLTGPAAFVFEGDWLA